MERLGLEGSWRLIRLKDGSQRPMQVPGDILSALLAAGEIPDPYAGRNELGLQWIGQEDWRLERDFDLAPGFLDCEEVLLEALVLDTVARLEVNGSLLGEGRNMFLPFQADARPLLKAGKNTIAVTIASPEKAAAEAAARLPYPIPYSQYPVTSPHRNLLRKAQFMGGWDWGPCLMTGGIYDGISLTAHDGPRIECLGTRMSRLGPGSWKVEVHVDVGWPPSPKKWGQSSEGFLLEARLAGKTASLALGAPREASRGQSCHLTLQVEGIEDWNPAGYGSQPLYSLEVDLVRPKAGPGGKAAGTGPGTELLWTQKKRLGFRSLEVVAEEDSWGKSMKFRVNGREIFAKGANWIPADSLPSRWTRARLEDLLGSARAANMNMLRVWGGGRYESEDFYGLCDELGILLWQDCMFSCALYPSDPGFLAGVEAEITHQVRRLKDHPSLALWCGNNEALGAITWYEESRDKPERYIEDYERLNEGVLGRVIRSLDPDRTWWPSSPSAGPGDFADNWHSDSRGDMHYWTVWHEGKPFSAYLEVEPRFCSEFGFQSLPSPRTVASYAKPEERDFSSPVMDAHQRHPRGNSLILETMLRYFREPRGFAQTLYLSQVQQALAIRTAVEFWRSLRPRCMGTLYWQLNDVWPVASWSSLEYDGGWKLLHHEARRFYEDLHLALIPKDGAVTAALINDRTEALEGTLRLALKAFDGRTLWEEGLEARVGPDSVARPWRREIAGPGLLGSGLALGPEQAFLEASYTARASGGRVERRLARAFLAEPRRCALAQPGLGFRVKDGPEGPRVHLRASAPAFFVALELDPESPIAGRFSDSGFDLGAGEEALVDFRPASGTPMPSAADLALALRLKDLRSSYA